MKIFPVRTPGWNKFNLAANNEKHTNAEVKTLLADFFSDAQIVWLPAGTNTGTGAWSANPSTAVKITALAAKDPTTYAIAANTGVMIHATDAIWAKF